MVVGLTAIALAAGADATSQPSSVTPAQRSALLAQFTAVLYFHAEEEWTPLTVERFLSLARVERQTVPGSWTRTTSGIPTSSVGCWHFHALLPLQPSLLVEVG